MKTIFIAMLFIVNPCLSIFAQTTTPGENDKSVTDTNEGLHFMNSYLEKCGGVYYAKCDTDDLNQSTIFKDAITKAKNEKKLLLVAFGADWCSGCVRFSKKMASEEGKRLFRNEKIIFVEINSWNRSGPKLVQDLKIGLNYTPYVIIFNPNDGRIIEQGKTFIPGSIKSASMLLKKAKRRWDFK